jgi:hypothetical protein
MSVFASLTKKLLTLLFLITLIFSSFGVKANAVYYTSLTQPICSNDILVRILSGVLSSGYSNCNYSNNCNQNYYSNCNKYNTYCDPNANVGKIVSVNGDQNTTTSNEVTINVTGAIITNCYNDPIRVSVNLIDQYGNYLILDNKRDIFPSSICSVNNFSYDCTNFTFQLKVQKTEFIGKTLRTEVNFVYNNYFVPFQNSNAFPLEYNNLTYINYDCSLYNTCFTDYTVYPVFGGINTYEAITPNTPIGCQLNSIDYYNNNDNCYFI